MPPSRSRTRAERRGRLGEAVAALFLRAQLFRIRHKRFKTPVGEIDLIAERGRLLVFVEVKTRASGADLDMALEAVNAERISRAADYYLARHPGLAGRDMRYDIILLKPFAWPWHIANAFDSATN